MLFSFYHSGMVLQRRDYARILVVGGLLLFWWLALETSLSKSLTTDEPIHIMRGVGLTQTGDLRFQFEHPPLTHRSMGLLQRLEPNIPDLRQLSAWTNGDRIDVANELYDSMSRAAIERLTFFSRLAIVLWGMVLASVIYLWSRKIAGVWAGVISLLLLATSPNFLASASLATTDALSATTMGLAVFGVWHYARRQTWRTLLLAGLTLGLGLGTKLTAVLLLPITGLLIFAYQCRKQSLFKIVLHWLKLMPLAIFVVWALYGFELRQTAPFSFPIPAATYVENFLTLQDHVSDGHATYLLGERSRSGWYHYFGVAFLIKTPLPTLLLLLSGVVLFWQKKQRANWRGWLSLWLPLALIFAAASYSRLNIGYRHILAMLPFVWVIAGVIGKGRGRSLTTLLVGVLLLWQGVGTIRQHPHHLAYFNEAVGGSENGRYYLADSNLDWGQDLFLLEKHVTQSENPVNVIYSSGSTLGKYAIETVPQNFTTGQYQAFSPANPAAGQYAIGISQLQGFSLLEPDSFDYFRRQTPAGNLGYSILLYDIPTAADGAWIAHCDNPAPRIDSDFAEQQVGKSNLRHLYFNCETSWVLPNGNSTGWYILPPNTDVSAATDLGIQLEKVYEHASSSLASSFEVYHLTAPVNAFTNMQKQANLASGGSVSLPHAIGDAANLLGYQVAGNRWITVWKAVRDAPPALSTLVHFYSSNPTPDLVADGLGYASSQWQAGDVWLQVQAHSEEQDIEFLATNLYNYNSGERLWVSPNNSELRLAK